MLLALLPPSIWQACLGAPDSDPNGEAAAIQAMLQGQADAAVVGLRHWEQISQRQSGALPVEKFWETPGYAHCVFTSRDTLDQGVVEPGWRASTRWTGTIQSTVD